MEHSSYSRRRFLRHLGAGSAVLTMPAFLNGCGVLPAIDLATPTPEEPFADWFALGERDLHRVLSELGAHGADFGEVYFQHARATRLVLEDGQPAPALADILHGAGLRVVNRGGEGFAATEDLTLPALRAAARDAAAAARGADVAQPGATVVPPRPLDRQGRGDLYRVAVAWSDVAAADKWAIVRRADASARAADPAVTAVTVEWRDSDERVLIATLDGRALDDRRPLTSLSVQVSATRGTETHSGFASISARDDVSWYSDERVADVAADAVARALIQFEARRPPSGELPVVLAAGTSGILLHEAIGHALEGDLYASGSSSYAGRRGETIAAKTVTLIDDATIAHARGALAVDDEGSDTRRNVLIEDGVLRSLLHDRRSAMRVGTASTGSARRESFRHPPLPRMSCTWLASGPHPAEELLAGVDLGILAETFTGGRADPDGGDFTFTVKNGWLLEKGRRTMPIRDVALSGNGAALLEGVTMVADDGRLGADSWTCGKLGQRVPVSLGMPTTLVSGLRVGHTASDPVTG